MKNSDCPVIVSKDEICKVTKQDYDKTIIDGLSVISEECNINWGTTVLENWSPRLISDVCDNGQLNGK